MQTLTRVVSVAEVDDTEDVPEMTAALRPVDPANRWTVDPASLLRTTGPTTDRNESRANVGGSEQRDRMRTPSWMVNAQRRVSRRTFRV
jgi:hypothetical protein